MKTNYKGIYMRRAIITLSILSTGLLAVITPSMAMANNHISADVQKLLNFSRLTNEHEFLGRLKGKWNGRGTLKANANGAVEKILCKANYKLILGKRFVEQTTVCKGAGFTFNGVAFFGYDLMNKYYVGTSMSDVDNGISQLTGQRKGNVINFTITHNNTSLRKRVNSKASIEIDADGRHKYTVFGKDENGKTVPTFTVSYTR